MAAIDTTRRYELNRLVQELRLEARTVRAQTLEERREIRDGLASRLRARLEPYAVEDEEGLDAIEAWTHALDDADVMDVDLLQELLYGIDALVRVHLWRETGLPLEPPRST
jgi:hypothetical protein